MTSGKKGSRHPLQSAVGIPITHTELIHLLSEAAELEHSIACQYLFAAYSLKQPGDDDRITNPQWTQIKEWSEALLRISIQEMRHLAQVFNLSTAIGATPMLRLTPFPQHVKHFTLGMEAALTPFNDQTIARLIRWEEPASALAPAPSAQAAYLAGVVQQAQTKDEALAMHLTYLRRVDRLLPDNERLFRSIKELYNLIDTSYPASGPGLVGGGNRIAITNEIVPFNEPLVTITSKDDASAAIGLIVEEGEGMGTKTGEQSHYQRLVELRQQLQDARHIDGSFEPARSVVANPVYAFFGNINQAVPGAHLITNSLARRVGAVFTGTYDLMLQLVLRSFTGAETDDQDVRQLLNAAMSLMAGVLRPLGVTLTALPAGTEYPDLRAGPSFEPYCSAQALPHRQSAWLYFRGRLQNLSDACQNLSSELGAHAAPDAVGFATRSRYDLSNAAALLQFWSRAFDPDGANTAPE